MASDGSRRVVRNGKRRRALRLGERSWPAGVWMLLLVSCASLSPEAKQVTTDLIGVDARVIRKCLGDTVYLDVREDGSEVWAFTFRAPEPAADVSIRRVTGQGTAYARPAIESGNPTERRNAGEGIERLKQGRLSAGQCLHVFTMAGGKVRQYVGRGRSSAGLNADSICISPLAACIPATAATDPAKPSAPR